MGYCLYGNPGSISDIEYHLSEQAMNYYWILSLLIPTMWLTLITLYPNQKD